jgi:hypothetical protein
MEVAGDVGDGWYEQDNQVTSKKTSDLIKLLEASDVAVANQGVTAM